MDAFYERLIVRAATVDELLSDDFEPLPGRKEDAEAAERRLDAWCKASASGDWSQFGRRLARDKLTTAQVLSRFSAVRRKPSAALPSWIDDAIWIEAALQEPGKNARPAAAPSQSEPCAFEDLLVPVVEKADALLWARFHAGASDGLTEGACACLRRSLLRELSALAAPALYERFVQARKAVAGAAKEPQGAQTAIYRQFVREMKTGGFRALFEAKPVLLRLIAVMARQWIDTSREFVERLNADLPAIRKTIVPSSGVARVAAIEGDLADRHNGGRSVRIVSFEDGSRVVYKPKDLRLDAAWHALIERLNRAGAPFELKVACAIARDGYGWAEFIEHSGCSDADGYRRFFQRAGAWLALLHCFAATDMHQENMIASGDHPVPIDLETIFHSTADQDKAVDAEAQAFNAATETIAGSVMMVGLLPVYGRSSDNKVFAVGGMTSDWNSKIKLAWDNINTDEMRPAQSHEVGNSIPNLPHIEGRYARFADHAEDFIAGFEAYAKFLLRRDEGELLAGLFSGFAGAPVRRVIRPTRFYDMLLQRLKNHRRMDDGVNWSAQADFVARLSDWDDKADPVWPLHRAERSALLTLNVPHFVSPSDGSGIRDEGGTAIQSGATSGMDRARARFRSFDEQDIAWQVTIIRQNIDSVARATGPPPRGRDLRQSPLQDAEGAAAKERFSAEADGIAEELARYAVRRGSSAAWFGLDWLGDSEVFQLVCLGPELYNGVSGIALFLAAHAAVAGRQSSGELALAATAHLRKDLKGRNAARIARSLGVGGATGLGSIVYALSLMSQSLKDDDLRADALTAARLITDELIAADKQLDVMGGSAGAILGLLRLHRDTRSEDVLGRAIKCGEHLLGQTRAGPEGHRTWSGAGSRPQGLNGMSHGAAGFAYALAALAAATGREDFAKAAAESIAFENGSYDSARHNWPDLRADGEPSWPCQWCHGAPGIGLARIATAKRGGMDPGLLTQDIRNALAGVEQGWPVRIDTLCCGTLGSIEFFCEASDALDRNDLRALARQRLMSVLDSAKLASDFRWNSGVRRFNLGLFRGLAGVGYTALRQVDGSLPNVLIWE